MEGAADNCLWRRSHFRRQWSVRDLQNSHITVTIVCSTVEEHITVTICQQLNSVQCQSHFRHQRCVSVICSTTIPCWWIETHMSGTCKAFVWGLAHDVSACAPHTSYLVRVFLHAPTVCLWSAAQTYPSRYVRYTHVSQLTSNLMRVSGVWSAALLYHNQHMCYRHVRSIQYWSHFRHQQWICHLWNNDTTVKTTGSTYVWWFKKEHLRSWLLWASAVCLCITVNPSVAHMCDNWNRTTGSTQCQCHLQNQHSLHDKNTICVGKFDVQVC